MEERTHEALIHTFISDGEFMLRIIWLGQVTQWALSTSEIARLTATCESWKELQDGC